VYDFIIHIKHGYTSVQVFQYNVAVSVMQ